MARKEDKIRIYDIPENFVDESRIINGMFKKRNFIEGIVLGLLGALPALVIPFNSFETKVAIVVACAGPLFIIANVGFNGDPLSTTIINIRRWFKGRKVMLYNSNTKMLKESPLSAMMEQESAGDKILDALDAIRERRRREAAKVRYVEGDTFEFEEDEDLTDIYAEEVYSGAEEEDIILPDEVQQAPTPAVKQQNLIVEEISARPRVVSVSEQDRSADGTPTVGNIGISVEIDDTEDMDEGGLF